MPRTSWPRTGSSSSCRSIASGQPLIYLCGHSLGLAPRAALDYVSEELAEWARSACSAITSRRGRGSTTRRTSPRACSTSPARAHEVVAMNSLTVNLHLMMASFYRPVGMRDKVLIEAGAFSSDRHAILGQIAWHKLDPDGTLIELAPRAGEETPAHRGHRSGDRRVAATSSRSCCGPACSTAPARPSTARASPRAAHRVGRARRVRHGACHRQPAAAAARLGRRLRRVVLLQISERRSRRDRRLLRARAALRAMRRRASPAGGATNRRRASRWRPTSGPRPAPPAGP